MANLPKTNTNSRPYQALSIVAAGTLVLPPNVATFLLTSSGAVAGQTIDLPWNTLDGDEIYIVSQYAVSGVTVAVQSGSGQTIAAGPGAVTALTAGVQVGYLKSGNTWYRVQ